MAALWRELWDVHEGWGGYKGTREERAYEQLATRLAEDARVRAGQPVLGRHIHLLAIHDESVVGQVEGWFERYGSDENTPVTCEVRSLIVSQDARARGAGRALLDGLASIARQLSRGAPVVLAAEVLEKNPAQAFYAHLGYSPVSWTARLRTSDALPPSKPEAYVARVATADDALSIAFLESSLAARRRNQGDMRFDRPRAIDATLVGALAAHLSRPDASDQRELVIVDRGGAVRASASLTVALLEPPFVPARRGLLGRFAIDFALDPKPLVATLTRLGCRLAKARGAETLELTDLDAPSSPLQEGAHLVGALPWSRIVERFA